MGEFSRNRNQPYEFLSIRAVSAEVNIVIVFHYISDYKFKFPYMRKMASDSTCSHAQSTGASQGPSFNLHYDHR